MLQNLGSKSYLLTARANLLGNSTAVSAAVDLEDYEGDIVFCLDASAGGSGITYAVKVTECDTEGGTYSDMTGGGFTTTGANTALQKKISVVALAAKKYD